MKFYKMDDLAKAGYVAAEYLLRGQALAERCLPTQIAVVLENRSSSLDTDLAHQRIVDGHLAGEICIRHRIQGENTFFIDDVPGTAERYARRLIARGTARAVICGRCEYFAGHHDVHLTLMEKI